MSLGQTFIETHRDSPSRPGRILALSIALLTPMTWALTVHAGGAGRDVLPWVVPVRATAERGIPQSKMVCVADPGIEGASPYLDGGYDV